MWAVALIIIAVAICNAELYKVMTADLPTPMSDKRIIGGFPTTIEKYPFAVQVLFKKKFHCGGSLVTKQHVLSAAHCFVDKKGKPRRVKDFTVRVGTTTLNSGGSVHSVKDIKIYESYNFMNGDNDVAVVVMTTLVDFNTSVAQRIQIAAQDAEVSDNSSVTAVGWGWTKLVSKANPSKVLMEVTVRKISLETCRDRYLKYRAKTRKLSPITDKMICAGIIDVGGKDTCIGDSGGPLLYEGILVGITSWGVDCANPEYPAIYARVAKFTNWIIDMAKQTAGNSGSLSNKVGAITLLTPLLYLILSV